MAFSILIKPVVFVDAEDAFEWYNKQVEGLGNRFYHHFLATLDNIQANPFNYSYLKEPVRKCRMKNFPYKIYYIVGVFIIVATILRLVICEARSNPLQ